jgi:hypothetical protein
VLYYYPNKPILISVNSPALLANNSDVDAEIKKNGARLCLWKSKEDSLKHPNFNDFIFWNRNKEVLKYTPSPELLDELNSLNIPDYTHIDAELLHFKTKKIKHFIYVYDIYRYKGKQLFCDLETRRNILEDIFKGKKFKNIEIAKRYQLSNYKALFDEVTKVEENEGLVLKNKKGTITWNLKDCIEVWWQQKIRKPNASYSM